MQPKNPGTTASTPVLIPRLIEKAAADNQSLLFVKKYKHKIRKNVIRQSLYINSYILLN